MHDVEGMIDLAVNKAVESESQVEIVRGPAAAKLNELGAIGAMLRFQSIWHDKIHIRGD